MKLKKLSLKTSHAQRGLRLDQLLAEWLPEALKQPISKAKCRKLIVAGAVYLNRRRVRIASKELLPNAMIEVYVDERRLFSDGRSKDVAFEMSDSCVLYEDPDLIVVDKPPGLPTQPTLDEARDNLYGAVRRYLKIREGLSEAPYLGLHHRLDRDTSGVILFTKTTRANAGVAALFSAHLARKVYQALCSAPRAELPGETWQIRNYLGKVAAQGKAQRFGAVRSGGDLAITDFTLLGRSARGCHIEARPLTGRTHQIRVHLAEQGLPILGDRAYGYEPRGLSVPRIMLHAARLTFPHPISNVEVSVDCPPPGDFTTCLRSLL